MTNESDLPAAYERAFEAHGYRADAAQASAAVALHALEYRLQRSAASPPGWLARLRNWGKGRSARPEPGRGVYLWGGVGRGKTFLMDVFHSQVDVPSRREHFHRFMKGVHEQLRRLHDTEDPLHRVANDMAGRFRLLCLDELFVSDIADAMILAGLFDGLVEAGVSLVFTSNCRPSDLYRDGLQRARFLPAIALIERHCEVIEVDAGADYRLRELEKAPLYFVPDDPAAGVSLAQRFEAIAGDAGVPEQKLQIEGRTITARRASADVVWFDFDTLCDGPRGQADYVEIARDYHAVFISSIPVFDATLENQARRFIALVDEFYDRNVKLVVSASASPEELYQGQQLAFEFQRTSSRLIEMQTHDYLARPHRP